MTSRSDCGGFMHNEFTSKKKIDMIIANDISVPDIGFGTDENAVVILTRDGEKETLPRQPKTQIARHICNRLVDIFASTKEVKKR